MATPYTYIDSTDFISSFTFDHIETYSFQRGREYELLHGQSQYIINDEGQFHSSAKKTNLFKSGDPVIDRIKKILLSEVVDIPNWLCAPFYRDAIVFYDRDHKIITPLNICLSCSYMETAKFNHINADYKTYDLFKRFFLDIGHEVEEPSYFAGEEIEKLKLKLKK